MFNYKVGELVGLRSMIMNVNDDIKRMLRNSDFSPNFLDNLLNAKFLAVQQVDSKIVGAAFVGGVMNTYGIEISENFQGRGLWKKLYDEILRECKNRKISFLMGTFKPDNLISIKIHMKLGFIPVFTFHYNKTEGREIVIILPIGRKGRLLKNFLRIFDTRTGNCILVILLLIMRPFLRHIIAYSNDVMPSVDFWYSVCNFEKINVFLNEIDVRSNN